MDPEQLQATNWWAVFAIILLIFIAVPQFDKFLEGILGIKDKLVDRKANKIVDAAMAGSDTLRTEVLSRFAHVDECLDRDYGRLNKMEKHVNDLRDRMDGHEARLDRYEARVGHLEDDSTMMLSAIMVILNKEINMAQESDVIDTVNNIHDYLIKTRKSHQHDEEDGR